MSKKIIIGVAGTVAGVAVALGVFMFMFGGEPSGDEADAEATPVHVEGKLGPHITLQDRVFNLQGGAGGQVYVKMQTIIEFETTSKEWAKVLRGCVATPRSVSAPMVSLMPRIADGGALDLEGAKVDPCTAAQAKLQEEFAHEIGTGRQLIEDAVLMVVSRRTAVEISTPEGKEALKADIKKAIEKLIPEPKVTRVLFTNFITQ